MDFQRSSKINSSKWTDLSFGPGKLPELFEKQAPAARFSKVPELYGPFSGVTIPSLSQERRGFKSSNFTVILLFVTLTTCKKIGFPEQAVDRFTNGFSGRKSFRDFRETGPTGTRFSKAPKRFGYRKKGEVLSNQISQSFYF